MSAYLDQPRRSLDQYLAELQERFDRLPMTHPERDQLAARIVRVEDQIAALDIGA